MDSLYRGFEQFKEFAVLRLISREWTNRLVATLHVNPRHLYRYFEVYLAKA